MPETLLSPEPCTPNLAVYCHAVAFSKPAEAGEKRHPAQRAARRFAWQAGQRSRRRRNERSECCMRPSSAHKFAGIGLQASGITLLRRSDSLRSLLSHFPFQLKLGKIRNAPLVLRLAPLGDLSRFAKQIAESPMREPQDFSPSWLTATAVAFSTPAKAGENPQVSR